MINKLHELKQSLAGELLTDEASLIIYSTDASIYYKRPLAIAIPANESDIEKLICFASSNNVPLTARTAGTSLAGQATGEGIIVDMSKHFRKILELNIDERYVVVQPGVVRDELNKYLEPYGLMFCPETSTSNRCMIGGMIGNNSCGDHSLIFGSTRDHLISVKCLLSDGSRVEFGPVSPDGFEAKCTGGSLESNIYKKLKEVLSDQENVREIQDNYPEPSIKRRNTGYALDIMLNTGVFDQKSHEVFNMARLICGSEGTLALVTEAKLNLIPVPRQKIALICAHFQTLEQSFEANLLALQHQPAAIELIDKTIISLTKNNLSQQQNRFFIKDEPAAVLIIELAHAEENILKQNSEMLIAALKAKNLGFHFPVVTGKDIAKVRNLRKAGLGVLTSITSEMKPHSFVEDTAVSPEKLPFFILEFRKMLEKYGVECAFYGHISTGELHLKPILNLRTKQGVEHLRSIAYDTALLIKKYHGSLSGEHGDGRLRAEFIPLVLGKKVYQCLKQIKEAFDPKYIFNRGKIIESPCIAEDLREQRLVSEPDIKTYFDFSGTNGLLRAIERCNGSADCRKSHFIGGLMCPSYMATLDENASTRARANLMREILAGKKNGNPFDKNELYNILDLCLMCKGCKIECPSGIDMTRYKEEFLQHYYDARHVPIRSRLIAGITSINHIGSYFPALFNFFAENQLFSSLLKKLLGFADNRHIPALGKSTLKSWASGFLKETNGSGKKVVFFADEFTNYNDVEIGKTAVSLLVKLGYYVQIAPVSQSGRTYFSKGLLKKAKKISQKNICNLKDLINDDTPFVGIEPSAILGFRDEVPDIVQKGLRQNAEIISRNSYTIEEFIVKEYENGQFSRAMFRNNELKILLHGHCHQKALSTVLPTKRMLEIPLGISVDEIPSGCCGMAGSFGFEKEHYNLSMKIGGLILFPAVNNADESTVICAPGTSCRQQIKDGTGRSAFHPIEILYNALL